MRDQPLLSLLTFLPLVGAVIVISIRGDKALVDRNARNVALFTTLFVLGWSFQLWSAFDDTTAAFQFEERAPWLAEGISYHMGVDGISMLFILLTTLLMPICVLASWSAIQDRVKEYMVAFLIMETTMIGVFSSLDFVQFYLFFEGGLIPMFLIIGVCEKFLSTLMCSVGWLTAFRGCVLAFSKRDSMMPRSRCVIW